MPFIAWINEVFPEAQAPYTLIEVTNRLQQYYHSRFNYAQVNRAFNHCRQCPATAHIVQPLNPGERHFYISAEAARRIARKVTNGTKPEHLQVSATAFRAVRRERADKSVLKANSNQTQIEVTVTRA